MLLKNLIKKENAIFGIALGLLPLFWIVSFFNKGLSVGLLFLLSLTIISFLTLFKIKADKKVYALFLIAILVHLAAVLFIEYSGFGFGGGADFDGYHKNAVDITERFLQGNFSLQNLGLLNYWPVPVAIVYTFTMPEMIVGQLFTVWLAALSVILAYFLVGEIGGSKRVAFLVGLLVVFYPSYLYFGSVLLKDTAVIPLILSGMLTSVKMLKKFTAAKFLLFFIVLTSIIHLRFYVGLALLFTFILSWFLVSNVRIKKRFIYGFIIIFLLGFSPLLVGDGYYGINFYKEFLNPEKITYSREVVYVSSFQKTAKTDQNFQTATTSQTNTTSQTATTSQTVTTSQTNTANPPKEAIISGENSSFVVETGLDEGPLTFIKNSFKSFVFSLLGPFPWQFRLERHQVALAETIPWYILIIISFYGMVRFIKKKGFLSFFKFHKFCLPLLIFSILALGALSLFINNYGIIVRIRIPMFISLISIMFIGLNSVVEGIYEKTFNNWRGRIYRILPFKKTI